jgi:hypothetical protein
LAHAFGTGASSGAGLSATAIDAARAARLWELSAAMVGLDVA